jgi:hypothetical protein
LYQANGWLRIFFTTEEIGENQQRLPEISGSLALNHAVSQGDSIEEG